MFYKQRQENSSFFTLRSSFPNEFFTLRSSFFTQLDFPSKFLDVDDRSILADALVTLGSFLYAAEAGAHTARHLLLHGYLTLNALLHGVSLDSTKHRSRTTRIYDSTVHAVFLYGIYYIALHTVLSILG